jgi:UDP-N-acetylglucosamine transferase subunit ALG13
MIFVTVGTSNLPFDRLVAVCDELAAHEQTVVQRGCSTVEVRRAVCLDFVPFHMLHEYVRVARVVVTHGGAGSILLALHEQKRAYVVPRLRRYGEAVDDHQSTLADELERRGLVTVVRDPRDLVHEIAKPLAGPAVAPRAGEPDLVDDLKRYLAGELGRARRSRPPSASVRGAGRRLADR